MWNFHLEKAFNKCCFRPCRWKRWYGKLYSPNTRINMQKKTLNDRNGPPHSKQWKNITALVSLTPFNLDLLAWLLWLYCPRSFQLLPNSDFTFFLIQRKFPIEWKPASLECSDTSKIVPMYWVGKKFHPCFSINSYRKIHTNFLANPIERSLLKLNFKAKNKCSSGVKR